MKKFLFTSIFATLSFVAFAFDFSVCAPKDIPSGASKEYDIYKNLDVKFAMPYKVADEQVLCFDICYPKMEAPKGGFPLIVYFHGGGWSGGERFSGYGFFNDEVRYYNEKGIAVATVTYRFSRWAKPRRDMSVCVIDAMDSLRYFTKYAKNLKINASKIGVYGHSAGGHLTFMVALADQEKFLGDKALQNVKYKVACAVPQSGPTSFTDSRADADNSFMKNKNQMRLPLGGRLDDVELLKKLSPAEYIKKDCPPMLILQGEKDTIVPQNAALFMMQRAKDVGAEQVECVISKGAQHSFEHAQEPNNDQLADIRRSFFLENLK